MDRVSLIFLLLCKAIQEGKQELGKEHMSRCPAQPSPVQPSPVQSVQHAAEEQKAAGLDARNGDKRAGIANWWYSKAGLMKGPSGHLHSFYVVGTF